MNGTRGIFEAEAYSALHRLAGHVGAAGNALVEAKHALELAGLDDLARQVEKAGELNRLASARLASIARQVEERR